LESSHTERFPMRRLIQPDLFVRAKVAIEEARRLVERKEQLQGEWTLLRRDLGFEFRSR
jgi:hypothetical protein